MEYKTLVNKSWCHPGAARLMRSSTGSDETALNVLLTFFCLLKRRGNVKQTET